MVIKMMSVNYQSFIANFNNPLYHIIDIREKNEFLESHIEGSINIPYNVLLNNFERILSKNYKYYIICSKGKTSIEIVRIINSKGFSAYSLIGGYDSFKRFNQ